MQQDASSMTAGSMASKTTDMILSQGSFHFTYCSDVIDENGPEMTINISD